MTDRCKACGQPLPPEPVRVAAHYMRHNHTFIRLEGRTVRELAEHATRVMRENSYGMLGPIRVLDGNSREVNVGLRSVSVHARDLSPADLDRWRRDIEEWVRVYESSPHVVQLLAARPAEAKTDSHTATQS